MVLAFHGIWSTMLSKIAWRCTPVILAARRWRLEELEVQKHPWQQTMFEVSLAYMWPWLQKAYQENPGKLRYGTVLTRTRVSGFIRFRQEKTTENGQGPRRVRVSLRHEPDDLKRNSKSEPISIQSWSSLDWLCMQSLFEEVISPEAWIRTGLRKSMRRMLLARACVCVYTHMHIHVRCCCFKEEIV